jgi:hypothetical protein
MAVRRIIRIAARSLAVVSVAIVIALGVFLLFPSRQLREQYDHAAGVRVWDNMVLNTLVLMVTLLAFAAVLFLLDRRLAGRSVRGG